MKTLLQGSSTLVLKIHVTHAKVTKSVQLDLSCPIFSICDQIRNAIREAEPEPGREGKDYGFFLPHEIPKNGIWLDSTKTLAQYILKQGDTLEYRYKYRNLTIQTQDSVKKTLLVDDSWTVSELMFAICAKMGIVNHEEYSLTRSLESKGPNNTETKQTNNSPSTLFQCTDNVDGAVNNGTNTSGNNQPGGTTESNKKKKSKTDDDLIWLNPSQTLRQQGIDEKEVLMLRRKFYFSDMNIDTHDPIQLGLLFLQLKSDILNGKHPVPLETAEKLAALQCQAEYGDKNPSKKKLPISVKECVSKDYSKSSGITKRILKFYSELAGKEPDEAKRQYCTLCRSLKTYGITFFSVKEHVVGKSKLVPRLLGVSRDRVVRLDEKTKEILKTWPLTSIKRWAGTYNAFTMDFGEYAPNEYYTAQTNKGEQISQLISGYIDIIMKHKKAEETQNTECVEESSVAEINIEPNQAEIVELRSCVTPRSIEEAMRDATDLHISLVSPQTVTTENDVGHQHNNLGHHNRDSSSLCGDFTMVTPIPSDTDATVITTATRRLQIVNDDDDDRTTTHHVHASLISGGCRNIDNENDGEEETEFIMDDYAMNETNISCHGTTVTTTNTTNTPTPVAITRQQGTRLTNQNTRVIGRNRSPDSFMTGGTIICHTVHRFNTAQKKLLVSINQDLEKLRQTRLQLDDHTLQTTLNLNDEEQGNIQKISKEYAIQNLGSMNTEVVQVLRSSKGAPLLGKSSGQIENVGDYVDQSESNALKNIEKSVKIITVHFPSFIENVKSLASSVGQNQQTVTVDEVTDLTTTSGGVVLDSDGDGQRVSMTQLSTSENNKNLIDAARQLADAFSGMLTAVKPQEEQKEIDFRRAILDAANRVGEASSELFRQITTPMTENNRITSPSSKVMSINSRLGRLLQNSDHDYEDSLIYLVRGVANETAQLVESIKRLATYHLKDGGSENHVATGFYQRLVGPVTQSGLSTSQLVTCVKILAPTINQASCTNQILAEIEDTKDSVDLVDTTFQGLVEDCRQLRNDHGYSILNSSGISTALENIRIGISRLEEHLRCGISVINFAPRIQNLEGFLHRYQTMKRILGGILTGTNDSIDEECVRAVLEMGGLVIDDIRDMLLSSNKEIEEIGDGNLSNVFLNKLALYHSRLQSIIQINSSTITSLDQNNILEYTFVLDSFTSCILYESLTRFIAHDQLIHNLYRSAQILLTTAHKLVISYCEMCPIDQIPESCKKVMSNSESLLLLMDQIKYEPNNDKIISRFITCSIYLVKCCTHFCSTIDNDSLVTQQSNELLVEILYNAVSQILAQCEHMDSCLETIYPIRSHIEMAAILTMLESNKLESLVSQVNIPNGPKIGVSQTIQISMAVLEKIRSNYNLTIYPHYHGIFELNYGGVQGSIHHNLDESDLGGGVTNIVPESCLLVNLYHNVFKMKQSINYEELINKFKNVVVLLFRLVLFGDNLLLDHGTNKLDQYPILKCIDELLSTLSSLQAKTESIFARFKTTILNKQRGFQNRLINNGRIQEQFDNDMYFEPGAGGRKFNRTLSAIERSIASIHQFKEALDDCQHNYHSKNFADNLDALYHGYLNVTKFCEDTLQETEYYRIIDDFIMFSMALLNLVQELENCSMSIGTGLEPDRAMENRVNSKTRAVYDSSTRLLQSLTEAMKQSFGIFSESLIKIRNTREKLAQFQSPNLLTWDRKIFCRILSEQELIKTNLEILKEIIDEKKPVVLDNQLYYIAESVSELCIITSHKFASFADRDEILYQILDLTVQLINSTIGLVKSNAVQSEDFDLFNNTRDQLEQTVSYLETRLRQNIPGYVECCSGLTEVTQLSHDLNEVEVSMASESTTNNITQPPQSDISNTIIKLCAKKLQTIGLSLIQLDRIIFYDEITLASSSLPTCLNSATSSLRIVVDNVVEATGNKISISDRLKQIIDYSNQLVDSYDQFLQYLNMAFLKIETSEYVRSNKEIKEAISDLLKFLKFMDEDLWKDLIRVLETNNKVGLKDVDLIDDGKKKDQANTVSGLITDEDTTILFASAGIKNSAFYQEMKSWSKSVPITTQNMGLLTQGTNRDQKILVPKNQAELANGDESLSPQIFRNLIQKTTDALLLDTKSLVENSGDSQKALASNAENVIKTISGLADDFEGRIITSRALPDSQLKMQQSINSVKSNINSIFPCEYDESSSRLTISNCPGLIQNGDIIRRGDPAPSLINHTSPIASSTTSNTFAVTKQIIQDRLNRFDISLNNSSPTSEEGIGTIDIEMEHVVAQASSVLGLTSELMRLPLIQLLQQLPTPSSATDVGRNISNQVQETFVEYVDSLEKLHQAILLASNRSELIMSSVGKYREQIRELGHQVGTQFLKLFDLLQQIQGNPQDKFSNSSMLDIFYMIQDAIKSLLEFSSQIKTNQYYQADQTKARRVSFREQSPFDTDQVSYTQSSTFNLNTSIKQKISELTHIHNELVHFNIQLMNPAQNSVYESLTKELIQLFKSCSDLIGYSQQCLNSDLSINPQYPDDVMISLSDNIDNLTTQLRYCLYDNQQHGGSSNNLSHYHSKDCFDRIVSYSSILDDAGLNLLQYFNRISPNMKNILDLLQTTSSRIHSNVSQISNIIKRL